MKSFTVKGWDLERFEPEYVRSRIQEASKHGINTISLSHEIVHNAEEILFDWHRYKHLNNFCEEAHRYGMRVFLWNAQINNPPEHLISTAEAPGHFYLNFDHPDLLSWLYDRYQRVVERVPNIDGIILGLTEGEWQIHRWPEDPYYYNMQKRKTLSDLPPDERIARVVGTVYESLSSKGKNLLVRDFLRTPAEMDAFKKAIDALPNDIGVYSKCVPNDWQYKYPPHPLLGKFPNRTQVMELDLYNETGGNDHSILLAPDYYKEQLQRARDCGLAGAIPRLDDGFATHQGTAREFNLYAYNQLIHDPNADTDPMWMAFFEPYYGNTGAAQVAIQCLKRSFDMVCANALRYIRNYPANIQAKKGAEATRQACHAF
ncbi:MAG: hypothetical protein QGG64_14370, partial [Candidatus Latescibacteria bacterium]|nr:hypothetical protein [Candidatus Latescibacterota bacterium]